MSVFLDRVKQALRDRYAIERELGRGGMATVYLAEDLKHHRQVAIKVLRPELAAVVGGERFLNEIKLTANLQHPRILPLFDSGESNGFLYYAMPFVEGETLRDRLKRERQLSIDDALRITNEVAAALAYAHERGVIHRDIKPENILLSSGEALVTDFGIAVAVGAAGGERLTETGFSVGTPEYMSPEQAAAETVLDGRSDVFSLGAVLYEMLGGEPPHTGPNPQAILARKLSEPPRSLTPLRSSVGAELDRAIRVALAPAPADRYATVHEFMVALESSRTEAPPSEGKAPQVSRSRKRLQLGVGLVAAAVLAVLAVVVMRYRVEGRASSGGRVGVAVFPFRASDSDAVRWSEQLPDLLATVLDGTPGIRVADPWSLWRKLRPDRGSRALSPTDPEEAERLAVGARADCFVLGSLTTESRALNLSIRIYRAGTAEPLQSLVLEGSVDSIAELVQRSAAEVIARVWPGDRAPAVPPLDRYTTHSADALKAYLVAKEAMRRGEINEAEAAIDTALALDSTFALALVDAITIKSWAQYMRGEAHNLTVLTERADRYSESLSERNRLRAKAALASVRTDGVAAAEAAAGILDIDSTDIDAWSSLAHYHLAYGWQYGADQEDALVASARALELDSSYVPALVTRVSLAFGSVSDEELDLLVERLRRIDTTTVLARNTLLGIEALALDDSSFVAFVDRVAAAGQQELIEVLRRLRSYHPERAEVLLEKRLQSAGPGTPTATALAEQGRLFIAEGSLGRVDSMFQVGAYQDSRVALTLRALLITATLAGVGDERIAGRAVTALETVLLPDSAAALFDRLPVWWIGWLVAAYHATFGDTAVTRRWQTAIGTLPAGGTPEDYRAALRSDLEARISARRGELDTALVLAKRAYDLWSIHTDDVAENDPEPAMRFLLGMLLRATDQPDSAEAILRSLVPPTTWMGFLTARASFELGQLAENRGAYETAARHYARALALWERGDPEIEDWRSQARDGLQRVVAEPRR